MNKIPNWVQGMGLSGAILLFTAIVLSIGFSCGKEAGLKACCMMLVFIGAFIIFKA